MKKYEIKTAIEDEKTISLALIGEITIYSVKDIKKIFEETVEKYKNFKFKLADVSKMDTAGFQLLMYMTRELQNNKVKYKIIKPSEDVKRIYNFFNEAI